VIRERGYESTIQRTVDGFDNFRSKSMRRNFGGRIITIGGSDNNDEDQSNIFISETSQYRLHRISKRMLVFVVPMEFIAVQPIV
jgi:hypothetical protein